MGFPRFPIRTPAIVFFFAALWLILWRELSSEWSVNDQYSYGWFVPFFALVLFWLRWEDRPQTAQSTNSKGESRKPIVAIVIAIVALVLLFPIRLFEIGNPDWRPLSWLHAISVVAITLVVLWSIGGAPWLKHFAFPVAFTLVAVPWVTPLEQPVVQGLMRIVAAISTEAVALFGIPARLEGHLIRIPDGLVGVNEACSGVRSLQTSLMIGLLFGELKRLSILRRFALILAAAAIAFVGNCARAFFLVWISATQNIPAAARWHDFAGYAIVVLVFIGSLALAALLGRRRYPLSANRYSETNNKERITNNEAAGWFSKFRLSYFATAIAWLIAVEVGAVAWYRAHETNLTRSAQWEVQWPRDAANFREIKIDEEVRRALRFDRGQAASWQLPAVNSAGDSRGGANPLQCTVFFFRWESGKNSALLANLHRPDVCLPSIGWNQTGDNGVKSYEVTPGFSLPFRHFEFRHGAREQPMQQTAQAFYCLWEDRVPRSSSNSSFSQMSGSASAWTRDERIRAVLEGRRHLGQQVMELIIQTRGNLNEQEIETEFAELIPHLIKATDH